MNNLFKIIKYLYNRISYNILRKNKQRLIQLINSTNMRIFTMIKEYQVGVIEYYIKLLTKLN